MKINHIDKQGVLGRAAAKRWHGLTSNRCISSLANHREALPVISEKITAVLYFMVFLSHLKIVKDKTIANRKMKACTVAHHVVQCVSANV